MLIKEDNWYALYTASRAEKKVMERLNNARINTYLPLRLVERKWSDRIKKVEVPLINGYIFVKANIKQFNTILSTSGIVSFLKEFGSPAIIPENQITALKFMNDNADDLEIEHDKVPLGSYVRVVRGKLTGLEGELIEIKGKNKIVIRIDHFGCALATISSSCIQAINNN